MKRILVLLSLFICLAFSNALSECKLPPGVSDTPAWTEGNPVRVRVHDEYEVYAEYDVCWRVNSNGEKEVILGEYRLVGIGSPGIGLYEIADILWRQHIKQVNIEEILFDYAVGQTIVSQNVFGDDDILKCPNYKNKYYNVFKATCISEPYYDFKNNEGRLIQTPCDGSGYCKYEYKYCYKEIDGQLVATYSKTLMEHIGTQCPETYVNIGNGKVFKCFPKMCYPDRKDIKLVNELDILTYDDAHYYDKFNLSAVPNTSN